MKNQAGIIATCSRAATILVLGVGACGPEEGEIGDGLDQAAPANVSQAGGSAAVSNNLQADFNGDGYADLAIGVPRDRVNGASAGAVNVLYGTEAGLSANSSPDAPANQLWTQDSPGVAGAAASGDDFGSALAAGDFNGDGFADLAIGAPLDSGNGGALNSGSVNVLYGSEQGLTAAANQLWHQNSGGILGVAEANDQFGQVLASGDFDGDGFADLVVGVPLEDIGSRVDAGVVQVIYGSPSGLSANGDRMWHQNSPGVPGLAQPGDRFGSALAAGDFDHDGLDDLAIGVPGEDLGPTINAGAVNVIHGSGSAQIWHRFTPGIPGLAHAGDEFGWALAVGDFDDDGFPDLAIGAPFEDVAGAIDAGTVNIIYGDVTGLTSAGAQIWHEDVAGVLGVATMFDRFGWALATGDFDDDDHDDLAIGVPGENVASELNAGNVNVLYGAAAGGFGDDQLWHQDSPGILDLAERRDAFGWSLAAGDFDGDGSADLAVGVPFEDLGVGLDDAGAVNVLYGVAGLGLTNAGNQFWHQNSPGVAGVADANDRFGWALQ